MIVKDLTVLRQKSAETTIEQCIELKVFERLEIELLASPTPGIGLAAVQIGLPLRACVVWIKAQKDEKPTLIRMINPRVENPYEPIRFQNERCLSVDGGVDTTRYAGCVGTWIDFDTKQQKSASFYGIESIVMQHETDHMDGVLMIDREAQKTVKIGRNDPCPCGSGKKYKKCYGG